MLESVYQAGLIDDLEDMFPGCIVLKNDSGYMPGIPDLSIFYGGRWAMLEVKKKRPTRASDWQPNQEWYIDKLDRMCFCRCIYPENEEEVLRELQQALSPRRTSRLLKS